MANKSYQKIYHYTVVFEPAEEGGYVASVPSLPGCVTQGETLDEAKKMAQEAIELYLEVLREENEEIPIELPGTVVMKIKIPKVELIRK